MSIVVTDGAERCEKRPRESMINLSISGGGRARSGSDVGIVGLR
jgi:hypothetical protein